MRKNVVGLLLALPLVFNGCVVSAVQNNDAELDKGLPIDYSERMATKITMEDIQNCAVLPQGRSRGILRDSSLPSFYEYGSDYGYKHLGTLENGEAMQNCYNTLQELGRTFAESTEDAIGYDFGYPYGIVYSMSLLEGEIEFAFDDLVVNDAIYAYYTFKHDHPEYYWLSADLFYAETYEGNAVLVPFIAPEYVEFSARSELNDVMDENFKTMYERAKAKMPDKYMTLMQIHDDICDATDYIWNSWDPENPVYLPPEHNIQGVLDGDGEADSACESYAKTAQLLMNAVGIPNVLVNGMANGGNHVWNAAMLNDGKFYYFDITWDDYLHNTDYWAKGSINFAGAISFENGVILCDGYDPKDDRILNRHFPYYRRLAYEIAEYYEDLVGGEWSIYTDPTYFQYDMPEISKDDYVYTQTDDKYIITSTNKNEDGSYDISFDDDIPAGCSVYIAQYNENGILLKTKITDHEEESFKTEPEAAEIKIFVLDRNLKPHADMKRIVI